jgi:hypothetical protein
MIVPEHSGFSGHVARRAFRLGDTATFTPNSADILNAAQPGSTPVTGAKQLADSRGHFIYQSTPQFINLGILGFTTLTSKDPSPLSTIFFTYGPGAGTVGFLRTSDLISGGWRIVSNDQAPEVYRVGGVANMPTAPVPTMEQLSAAIDAILNELNTAQSMISSNDAASALQNLALADAGLLDAIWAADLMLDGGQILGNSYASIIKVLDGFKSVSDALKKEIQSPTGTIEKISSGALVALDKLFDDSADSIGVEAYNYSQKADGLRKLREDESQLLQMLASQKDNPKISPLLNMLGFDVKMFDTVISKLNEEEKDTAPATVEGYYGLGLTDMSSGGGIGRLFRILIKGRPLTLAERAVAKEAVNKAELAARGLWKPSMVSRLANWGIKSGAYLMTHIIPAYLIFGRNTPWNAQADLEAEKRQVVWRIAEDELLRLQQQTGSYKDALLKLPEILKGIEDQLKINPIDFPNIAGLDPASAALKAKLLSDVRKEVDSKTNALVGGPPVFLYLLLGGAALFVVYKLFIKKDDEASPKVAIAHKRRR